MIFVKVNMEEMNIQILRIKQHSHPWLKRDDQSLRQSGKRWMQGSLQKNMLREMDGSSIQCQADSQNFQEKVGLRELTKLEINQPSGKQQNEQRKCICGNR